MNARTIVLAAALVASATALILLVADECSADETVSPFQNVQILTHVKSKGEMRAYMKEQAKGLGVKCTFCHVQGKFHLDDKEHKVQAREMMKMVNEINANWFADEEQGITCWTCHRGNEEPELTRPPGTDSAGEGFEAAEDEGE